MILKRAFLNNLTAMTALDKLSTSDKMSADIAYRVGKLHGRLRKEILITRDTWVGLLKTYAVIDEKGEPVFADGRPTFSDKEKEEAHDAAFEKLMSVEFEEHVNAIPLEALKDCGLTPEELVALEPVLSL